MTDAIRDPDGIGLRSLLAGLHVLSLKENEQAVNKLLSPVALGMTQVLSGPGTQEVMMDRTGATPSQFRERNATMARLSGTTVPTPAALVASTEECSPISFGGGDDIHSALPSQAVTTLPQSAARTGSKRRVTLTTVTTPAVMVPSIEQELPNTGDGESHQSRRLREAVVNI